MITKKGPNAWKEKSISSYNKNKIDMITLNDY